MPNPKALLALSMKGGVGKTTTAIGMARALQRRGYRIGLLDVDIHGSALPRALRLARDPGHEPLVGASVRVPEESLAEIDRNEEILRRHLAGMGVKRIAGELHHSRKTVTTVIRAMRRRAA